MSRAVWVTRDIYSEYGRGAYNLHTKRPTKMNFSSVGVWAECAIEIDAWLFERITGFRLNPGEGPVKIRIKVERVK